jgi:hypothetical protein
MTYCSKCGMKRSYCTTCGAMLECTCDKGIGVAGAHFCSRPIMLGRESTGYCASCGQAMPTKQFCTTCGEDITPRHKCPDGSLAGLGLDTPHFCKKQRW